MIKKSTQVAMGGIASALCLLLMILTIIPIATYTMPALAGMVLIVVVIEKWLLNSLDGLCCGRISVFVHLSG